MHAAIHGERTLTDLDHARLSKLRNLTLSTSLADWLESVNLTSSQTVTADRVTMYPRVEKVDVDTHRRQVLTVCYPDDAAPSAGFNPLISPVGSRVIGVEAGDIAKWLTPLGDIWAAEITAVQYQPEAAGYHTR